MMFTRQGDFSQKPTDLPDRPSPTFSATEIKQHFQTPSDELRTALNRLINELEANTAAANIGAKTKDGENATIQQVLAMIQTEINDIVINGSEHLAVEALTGPNGETYSSLKQRLDTKETEFSTTLETKAEENDLSDLTTRVNALNTEQISQYNRLVDAEYNIGFMNSMLSQKVSKTELTNVSNQVNTKADKELGALVQPTLLNGWSNRITARYYKNAFGEVCLMGRIEPGTSTNGTILFTLPSGFRPIQNMIFRQRSGDVYVETNGNVSIHDLSGPYVALDGIFFRTTS